MSNAESSTEGTRTGSTCTPKTVYLIRHAESEENRRIHSLKSSFGALGRLSLPKSTDVFASFELVNVPAQIDSHVSEKGRQQIAHIKEKLDKDKFLETHHVQVVVHSPLKRARDTSQGMLGCLAGGDDGDQEEKATTVERVEQLDLLSEKTPSEWLPGGTAKLYQRIEDFQAWVGTQTETSIVVVGHSQYFRAMLGTKSLFGNCEVWQVQYDPSKTSSSEAETCTEGNTLKPGWSGLKRLYSYDPPTETPEEGATTNSSCPC